MSLATVPDNCAVRITAVRPGPLACRLMELGLIEGARVRVLGRAPLGDPLRVRVGDYDLSLRRQDARLIDVCAA